MARRRREGGLVAPLSVGNAASAPLWSRAAGGPPRIQARWLAALALLASCFAIQGCSDDDPPEPKPSTPAPTGSPFSATLEGPDVASPGDEVTATLTNTGRLPDVYRLVSDPEGAATFTPVEVRLAPQASAEVTIEVSTPPVIVKVESIGGGGPGTALAELSIGAQGGA